MSDKMTDAMAFFDACETGKGWGGCQAYCTADATFASQAGALAGITTLAAYCDWMTGLLGILPNGSYALKSAAYDAERNSVIAYAVFTGTHTGEGGPIPATGKTTNSDYVYNIVLDDDGKVKHMDKIWNDSAALVELGWA